jgi:hypothetical protein
MRSELSLGHFRTEDMGDQKQSQNLEHDCGRGCIVQDVTVRGWIETDTSQI